MDNTEKQKAQVGDAATNLINEGKKYASALYEEGLHKVNDAESTIKEHSDDLIQKIQENPLSSILIAGGIGFLLAKLMKK